MVAHNASFDFRVIHKENRTEFSINDYNEVADEFSENLWQLISDIFNPEISFSQTEEAQDCKFCPYKKICHR